LELAVYMLNVEIDKMLEETRVELGVVELYTT